MSWSDDEIDELLVRYIDQELSSDELERFESLLTHEPTVRQRLFAWNEMRQGLKRLAGKATTSANLGSSFADRVIRTAQIRVRESNDPQLAPWIARAEPTPTLDSASRLRERDSDASLLDTKSPSARRSWLLGIAASGIAASLLAFAYWSSPQ